MRCLELFPEFGIENLRWNDRELPSPSPNQVLVRLKASSLNYRDLLMVTGKYNSRQKLPLVPCSDGAGEVVSVGSDVKHWKSGDTVLPIFAQAWQEGQPDLDTLRTTLGGPLDGCLTEYALFDESGLVSKPNHLSFAEASTLACAGLTAWNAISLLTSSISQNPSSNPTVVILGTGGVSLFALQFAKSLGYRVILTSSSDDKLERGKSLGADEVINYNKRTNWERDVRKMTQMKGADLVIEVGGAGTLSKSVMSLRPGGIVALIGVLAGGEANLSLFPILMQGLRIQGVIVGSKQDFNKMNQHIETHKIHPIVDKLYSWELAKQAFSHLESGTHFGKIVLELNT